MKNHLTTTYRHTSMLKIVPLVVWVYSVDFVKCFDIVVVCFILNQSGQLWIKEKNNNIFTGLNVFFKALNIRFWQVSKNFNYTICDWLVTPHDFWISCDRQNTIKLMSKSNLFCPRTKVCFAWGLNQRSSDYKIDWPYWVSLGSVCLTFCQSL